MTALAAAGPIPQVAGEASVEAPANASQASLAYVVVRGDNLSKIAQRFGINETTIALANGLANSNFLREGQELAIPSVDGILHRIAPGDTIASIAAQYGVDAADIMGYKPNGLVNANTLVIGKELVIPGAVARMGATVRSANPPKPEPARAGAGSFSWPTIGPIYTYFGEAGHEGIDISPPYGTPVYAARDGVVVEEVKLGWSYGWYVLVDHGDGYRTRYAHLSQFSVGNGEWVTRGQLIGTVGSTGRSTGPHLHFEIIKNGVPVNPLNYLP